MAKLTTKQRRFVEEYFVDFNATQAAIRAGYSESTARSIASENLSKPDIKAEIQSKLNALTMTLDEALVKLSDFARGSFKPFLKVDEVGNVKLALHTDEAQDSIHLIRKVKQTERRFGSPEDQITDVTTEIEIHDAKDAVKSVLQLHGKLIDRKVSMSAKIENLSDDQLNNLIERILIETKS